ncbi:hypothetical protein BTVI_63061 [Pitangus sulphuratus]|nr:hypothetical protein BTVI_63061 [Pitangus sulphuratus]
MAAGMASLPFPCLGKNLQEGDKHRDRDGERGYQRTYSNYEIINVYVNLFSQVPGTAFHRDDGVLQQRTRDHFGLVMGCELTGLITCAQCKVLAISIADIYGEDIAIILLRCYTLISGYSLSVELRSLSWISFFFFPALGVYESDPEDRRTDGSASPPEKNYCKMQGVFYLLDFLPVALKQQVNYRSTMFFLGLKRIVELPQFSPPFLIGGMLQSFHHLCGLSLDSFRTTLQSSDLGRGWHIFMWKLELQTQIHKCHTFLPSRLSFSRLITSQANHNQIILSASTGAKEDMNRYHPSLRPKFR